MITKRMKTGLLEHCQWEGYGSVGRENYVYEGCKMGTVWVGKRVPSACGQGWLTDKNVNTIDIR